MTELNVDDEITSTEQLEELPIGTILKHLGYNYPHSLAWVKTGEDEWVQQPRNTPVTSKGLRERTYEGLLTILDLPTPTNWKVGDTVTTVAETFTLPKGAVCCTTESHYIAALARDLKTGYWYATGVEYEIQADYMNGLLPLRILHLPEGDETNDHSKNLA